MMRNRRFTIVLPLALLLISLWALVPIQAQTNLLTNPGFENVPNYVPFGRNDFTIAPGWGGWWTAQPRTESWMNIEPIAFPESRADFRRDGAFAQNIGRGQGTFTAALYQVVGGIAPGSTLRFSVDVLHLNVSESGSQTRVGIGTGTNPQDPNIVWSPWNRVMQQWANVAVEATVAGPDVTVFIYSTQTFPNDSNQNFYDAASLIVTGQGEVPVDPNVPPPPPTQPPVAIAAFVSPQDNVVEGRVVHTVQAGDTLAAIAVAYNVTLDEIRQLNNIGDSFLQIGQQLVIREAPIAPVEEVVAAPESSEPTAEIIGPIGADDGPRLSTAERIRLIIQMFRRGPALPGRLDRSNAPGATLGLVPSAPRQSVAQVLPTVEVPVITDPPPTEETVIEAPPTAEEPVVEAPPPTEPGDAEPPPGEAVVVAPPTSEIPASEAAPTEELTAAQPAEMAGLAVAQVTPEVQSPPPTESEPETAPETVAEPSNEEPENTSEEPETAPEEAPAPLVPVATATDAPPAPVQQGISADPTIIDAAMCVLLFEDRDQNRIQSPDETLLGGGQIVLRDANNQELSSYETSGSDEPFCFERLTPGRYTAQAEAPAGYGLTTPATLVVSVQAGQRFQINFGAGQGIASAAVPTPDGVGLVDVEPDIIPDEPQASLSDTLRDLAGLLVLGLAAVVLVVGGIIAVVARRM